MSSNTIYISIIIPTYNRLKELSICLENLIFSIETTNYSNYEIIISDDNFDINNKIYFENLYSKLSFIQGPQKGPAANRNKASKAAKGNWLIFIDDDCIPSLDFFKSYLIYIENNKMIIEGKTISDREKQRFDEVAPINEYGNKLWSCNFAINKRIFELSNGFDENFKHSTMEDIDFKMRVEKIETIYFNKNAIVIHPWRRRIAFKNFFSRLRSQRYFKNKHSNLFKHYRKDRVKIFLGSIPGQTASLVKYSGKGWFVFIEKTIFNFFMIFN